MKSKATHALGHALLPLLLLAGAARAETVKSAVLAPLTGSISAIGKDMQTGAQLAFEERKAEFAKLGLELELTVLDDQGEPSVGARLAQDLARDARVLGIVGPNKSGVSLRVGETLAALGNPPAVISPSSTDDDLTLRGWKFYHRVIAPAGAQAAVIAAYMDEKVRPRGVYIVGDNQTFSNGLSDAVASELKKRGVKVAGRGTASVGDAAAIGAQVSSSTASGADVVFHAGLQDSA